MGPVVAKQGFLFTVRRSPNRNIYSVRRLLFYPSSDHNRGNRIVRNGPG